MGPGNTQLTCDCGSTFFMKFSAEQFLSGGYGSAEFRSTSGAPKTVLVCLCGKPYPTKPTAGLSMKTVAGIAENDFQKSVQSAQKRRDEASLKHVAEISASPSEVKRLREEVTELRTALNSALESKSVQPKEAAPKQPAKSKRVQPTEVVHAGAAS